ncbi:MAG: type III-A CRISPR-associated RAMP protein Csm3 [Candidatus Zixiibacteriota bacterium]|nr:MAG: type III-A CRISPR-associated RAMP protein Csm3 [candidate division Zixibacteria bacterium]
MKLEGYTTIDGQIECLTGLKIGGTRESGGIGETDNPIIRHPVTRFPYLPGSSLKGKLRSLLEIKYRPHSQNTGEPCNCGKCFVCTLFGCGDQAESFQPTRLIFRDAKVSQKTKDELEESLPGSYAEVKTEIKMDRKAGKAARGALRQQERVPEGAIFDFSISMRLFEEDTPDKRKEYIERLAEAFDLLEKDYLGGCGTRGYGKVRITHDGKPMSEYLKSLSL